MRGGKKGKQQSARDSEKHEASKRARHRKEEKRIRKYEGRSRDDTIAKTIQTEVTAKQETIRTS